MKLRDFNIYREVSAIYTDLKIAKFADDEIPGVIRTGFMSHDDKYAVKTDLCGNAYVQMTDHDTVYTGKNGIKVDNIAKEISLTASIRDIDGWNTMTDIYADKNHTHTVSDITDLRDNIYFKNETSSKIELDGAFGKLSVSPYIFERGLNVEQRTERLSAITVNTDDITISVNGSGKLECLVEDTKYTAGEAVTINAEDNNKINVNVDDSTIKVVDNKLSVVKSETKYNFTNGLTSDDITGVINVTANCDNNTISVNSDGKLECTVKSIVYKGGNATDIDTDNKINVNIDNDTIKIVDNKLKCVVEGVTYGSGNAISIDTDNKINTLVDGTTIGIKDNKLKCLVQDTTYAAGTAITINSEQNNSINVNVDNNTIGIEDNKLKCLVKDTKYTAGEAVTINDRDNNKINVNVDDSTIKIVDNKLSAILSETKYIFSSGLSSGIDSAGKVNVVADCDNTSISVNGSGKLECLVEDTKYTAGDAVTINAEDNNKINVNVDNDTIKIVDNKLKCVVEGVTYGSGNAISIDTDNKINTLVDGTTIGIKDNKLKCLVQDTTYSAGNAISIDLNNNNSINVNVDDSTIKIVDDKLKCFVHDTTYSAGNAIVIDDQDNNKINVNVDDSTIKVVDNKLKCVVEGVTYGSGNAISIDTDNKINTLVDGTTVGIEDNKLKCLVEDTKYTAGEAVTINDRDNNKINVNVDNNTIKVVDNKLSVTTQETVYGFSSGLSSGIDSAGKVNVVADCDNTSISVNGSGKLECLVHDTTYSAGSAIVINDQDNNKININVDNDTIKIVDNKLSVIKSETKYQFINGLSSVVNGDTVNVYANCDGTTIKVDKTTGKLVCIKTGGDDKYTAGKAIEFKNIGSGNAISVNVKYDQNQFDLNMDGELIYKGSSSDYTGGDGIIVDNVSRKISAAIDNESIKSNNGILYVDPDYISSVAPPLNIGPDKSRGLDWSGDTSTLICIKSPGEDWEFKFDESGYLRLRNSPITELQTSGYNGINVMQDEYGAGKYKIDIELDESITKAVAQLSTRLSVNAELADGTTKTQIWSLASADVQIYQPKVTALSGNGIAVHDMSELTADGAYPRYNVYLDKDTPINCTVSSITVISGGNMIFNDNSKISINGNTQVTSDTGNGVIEIPGMLTVDISANTISYGDVINATSGDISNVINGDVYNYNYGDEINNISGDISVTVLGNTINNISGDTYNTVSGDTYNTTNGDINNTVNGNTYNIFNGDTSTTNIGTTIAMYDGPVSVSYNDNTRIDYGSSAVVNFDNTLKIDTSNQNITFDYNSSLTFNGDNQFNISGDLTFNQNNSSKVLINNLSTRNLTSDAAIFNNGLSVAQNADVNFGGDMFTILSNLMGGRTLEIKAAAPNEQVIIAPTEITNSVNGTNVNLGDPYNYGGLCILTLSTSQEGPEIQQRYTAIGGFNDLSIRVQISAIGQPDQYQEVLYTSEDSMTRAKFLEIKETASCDVKIDASEFKIGQVDYDQYTTDYGILQSNAGSFNVGAMTCDIRSGIIDKTKSGLYITRVADMAGVSAETTLNAEYINTGSLIAKLPGSYSGNQVCVINTVSTENGYEFNIGDFQSSGPVMPGALSVNGHFTNLSADNITLNNFKPSAIEIGNKLKITDSERFINVQSLSVGSGYNNLIEADDKNGTGGSIKIQGKKFSVNMEDMNISAKNGINIKSYYKPDDPYAVASEMNFNMTSSNVKIGDINNKITVSKGQSGININTMSDIDIHSSTGININTGNIVFTDISELSNIELHQIDNTQSKRSIYVLSDMTIGDVEFAAFVKTKTEDIIKIYTNADPSEGGEVTGAGTYAIGESAALIATANSGYSFKYWNDDQSDTNPQKYITVTAGIPTTYTAHFEKNEVIITTAADPAEGGTVTGAGTYQSGDTCTLQATANQGYHFGNWNDDVMDTEPVKNLTILKPMYRTDYTAHFIRDPF